MARVVLRARLHPDPPLVGRGRGLARTATRGRRARCAGPRRAGRRRPRSVAGGSAGRATGRARRRTLGYSMGGRLGLHVALAHPDFVDALVLVGATAGIRDDVGARRRRRTTTRHARRASSATASTPSCSEWLAQPLFASLPPEARALDDRRTNTAEGLAASLRLAGTGAQEPLWDRLARAGDARAARGGRAGREVHGAGPRDGGGDRRQRARGARWRAPATPPISSSPTRSSSSCARSCANATTVPTPATSRTRAAAAPFAAARRSARARALRAHQPARVDRERQREQR